MQKSNGEEIILKIERNGEILEYNIKLTEELYHQFKIGESTYKKLNLERFILMIELMKLV